MSGLYIHIPFCGRKCSYCDFYSIVASPLHEAYITAICQELKLRIGEIINKNLHTVYIGGGTPSIIDAKIISPFLTQLNKELECEQINEFTVEMNPDDVSESKVSTFKSFGCNRVSMGVQSFVNDELKSIYRRHTAETATDALNIIRQCGIDNVNLDLMFGLPGQTLQTLEYSLDRLIELHPNHISCYGLMYEPGTLIYRMRAEGRIREADDDTYIKMYTLVSDKLKDAGYVHYEISNYALPGFESKHNSAYWSGEPYLGLGPSAHSFDGNSIRRSNPANVREYIKRLSVGELAYDEEQESFTDIHNDFILTRLRTISGIHKNDYVARFGNSLWNSVVNKCLHSFAPEVFSHLSDECVSLNESGFLISDDIISELFID